MEALPGTKLMAEEGRLRFGFANISPLISATKGLTLSQVCEITGIEGSTIQNWIKRGWVAHPQSKRYGEYQLSRIIIINMLRPSMQLEKIAVLLRYINGSADDRGDDIIPDSELYTRLCIIIDNVMLSHITETEDAVNTVTASLSDYKEVYPGAKQKLIDALTVMTLGYISAQIKRKADVIFDKLGVSAK